MVRSTTQKAKVAILTALGAVIGMLTWLLLRAFYVVLRDLLSPYSLGWVPDAAVVLAAAVLVYRRFAHRRRDAAEGGSTARNGEGGRAHR